jgi:Amt family ammonium transporter
MKLKTLIPAFGAFMIASSAQAQETAVAVPTDTVFILNSLLFLIGGFLVFWMAAGFSMLEAGLVRSKNVTMQLTKNMGLFGFACLAYYFVGYNLMYPLGTWATEGVISGIWGPAVLEAVGVDAAGGRRLLLCFNRFRFFLPVNVLCCNCIDSFWCFS